MDDKTQKKIAKVSLSVSNLSLRKNVKEFKWRWTEYFQLQYANVTEAHQLILVVELYTYLLFDNRFVYSLSMYTDKNNLWDLLYKNEVLALSFSK